MVSDKKIRLCAKDIIEAMNLKKRGECSYSRWRTCAEVA